MFGIDRESMSHADTGHEVRTLAGVPLVDTPTVRAALEYARVNLDPMSFNHVYRSWVFGCLISTKVPAYEMVDREVHAVSAILHDLAWVHTSAFSTPDKRFEVDGANAARDYLKREAPQFDQRRLQLVWDSIALHTTPSIAMHKELEVALCNAGICIDFAGPAFPGGLVTKEEYIAVIAELPLLDFKESVKRIMCGLCVHKPQTTYDNFVREFGEKYVDGYSVGPHTTIDFMMAPIDLESI